MILEYFEYIKLGYSWSYYITKEILSEVFKNMFTRFIQSNTENRDRRRRGEVCKPATIWIRIYSVYTSIPSILNILS